MKRWIEKEALETLGENKASYAMKAAMDQVPDADQEVLPILRSLG